MKPGLPTKKRNNVNPAIAIIIVVLFIIVCGVIGWKYMTPKPPTIEAPQMTPEVRKQRQAESMAWAEEMKRAEQEKRLPDYSKLPRAGHAGAGGPMSQSPPPTGK